jgi:catechol 2,3-dioxygenase-like lactoylglutathione lyase family enzyme
VSAEASARWPGGLAAVTLFVEDVAAAKAFYEDVFGLDAIDETEDSVAFRFGATIVNLLDETSAPELIAPVSVAPRGAGARLQLTLAVDDVDEVCAALAAKGVELLNGPIDRPWGVRTATFRDPGGHIWEIAR